MIPVEKLRDYALNPNHRDGRHKARVFQSALGITRLDWSYLRDEIRRGLLSDEVSASRESEWGIEYAVPVLVRGLNGREARVLTAWIATAAEPPRLTSVYVLDPSRPIIDP